MGEGVVESEGHRQYCDGSLLSAPSMWDLGCQLLYVVSSALTAILQGGFYCLYLTGKEIETKHLGSLFKSIIYGNTNCCNKLSLRFQRLNILEVAFSLCNKSMSVLLVSDSETQIYFIL